MVLSVSRKNPDRFLLLPSELVTAQGENKKMNGATEKALAQELLPWGLPSHVLPTTGNTQVGHLTLWTSAASSSPRLSISLEIPQTKAVHPKCPPVLSTSQPFLQLRSPESLLL